MHCVNHPGTEVQSYCQHCGKPLCANCVRTTPAGQIFCETCFTAAAGGDPAKTAWAGVNYQGQPVPGFAVPFHRGPNPSAAAVLGLIPGVGAMYNGQLFKGLIHVVIFAVLVSITDHYPIFGIFIAAWILYQSFEAFHTAKARRDGTPVPDPFGLNELSSWLNVGSSNRTPISPEPGVNSPPPPPGGQAGGYAQATEPPPYSAPYTSSWSGYAPGTGPIPQTPPYTEPYAGPEPYAEDYPPGVIPPIPPAPPFQWRRREPVFAFVLIGLGIIFLLQSMGIVGHIMHYIWPLMLIGLGVWMIMRRIGYTQGGSK